MKASGVRLPVHPAHRALLEQSAIPDAPATNCVFAYRVSGDLLAHRLAGAYRQALADIDALSLVIDHGGTDPQWVIGPDIRAVVHLDETSLIDAIEANAARWSAVRFQSEAGPLGEIRIMRCAQHEWLVTETFTHIIADGRALALLHDRVSDLYSGGREPARAGSYQQLLRNASSCPDQPWHQWFEGFKLAKLPPDPGSSARSMTVELSPERCDQLIRAGGRYRASLATALMAAHAHAVARFTGSGDVATYLAADARTPEQSEVFGQATVLAPIRARHDWSTLVAEHVQRLSRRLMEARDYLSADLRSLDLKGVLEPLNSPSATALVFQDRPLVPPELPGLNATVVDLPDQHQAGGLTTVARRRADGGLGLQLRCPPGSALARHLDGITGTLTAFLDTLVEAPDERLGSDRLLMASMAELVRAIAAPTAPFPPNDQAQEIVRSLSRTTHTVVIENGIARTSTELHCEIEARVSSLRDREVGRGDAVLVDDRTSFGRIASFLAVLQLHAIYVPMTADLPPAARREMGVRTSAVATLIDGHADVTGHSRRLSQPAGVRGRPAPEDPAYVIFTSGSSGQPKGVVVSRMALANLAQGEPSRFGIGPADRVLLIAPPSTDPWICHVLGALSVGACLVPADLRTTSLVDALSTGQITHAFLPAALFADLGDTELPSLRMLASAGDQCSPSALATQLGRPGVAVHNIYGPTEATVTSSVHRVTRVEDPVPIGSPIRGAGARVAIESGASAPIGVTGELWLSGAGLAIGYLADSEATVHRFKSDPFGDGHRWYATGDRAWLGGDGLLRVAGRLDRQIKVRGFRVEPGHLEAVARASGHCGDAVALIPPNSVPDERRLHLFVTECPSPERLLDALRLALPPALVPSAVVPVPQLPRTKAGKIDTGALTAAIEPRVDATTADPADPAALAWQRVLGVVPQPDEDFFAAGGDSLLALRLVRELRRVGVNLSPADVYRERTFAGLISGSTRPLAQTEALGDAMTASPLGPSQQWFFQLGLPRPEHWNQRHEITFDVLPELADLAAALRELLRATPILRARINPEAMHWQGDPPKIDLEERRGPLARTDLEAVLTRLHGGMEPSRGRLLRAVVIREHDGSGAMLLAAHHLAVDDWSWRLVEDRIRTALRRPETSLPIDRGFQQFATAVDRLRIAGAFELDAPAWHSVLLSADPSGASSATRRPSARQRIELDLPDDPRADARQWGVRLAAVLLARLGHALDQLEPGRVSVVDLERNGRGAIPDLDLSDAVGWIALHHPVAVPHTLLGAESAKAIDTALDDISDEGVSYGALRWSGTDLGTRIGRLAVNITDDGSSRADGPHTERRTQLQLVTGSATTPENRLPHAASLVFRSDKDGRVRAELDVDSTVLPLEDARAFLQALAEPAPSSPASRVSQTRSVRHPFQEPIPLSAMQRLMVHCATYGSGVYLPRQVLVLSRISGSAPEFLDAAARTLGQLDPFRRRIGLREGQLMQWAEPPQPVQISQVGGGDDAATRWMEDSGGLDPLAAQHGLPLVQLTAFTDPGQPVLLGMQVHHAVMDGQSNHILNDVLARLAHAYRTGSPMRSDTQDRSALAVRRHVSAEQAFLGCPAICIPSSAVASAASVSTATLGPGDTRLLQEWSQHHDVDLRSLLTAAAMVVAREYHPGASVYVVSNGRTPDIADTMTGLGLFWYFDPQQPGQEPLAALAAGAFRRAAAPLLSLRARVVQNWIGWTTPAGLSFNYLKARTAGAAKAEIRTHQHRDRFHLPDGLEVLHRVEEGTLQVRWLTTSGAAAAAARLEQYLGQLRQIHGRTDQRRIG